MNVDDINFRRLERHPGDARVYQMVSGGNEKLIPFLKNSCLSPEKLILKIGVPVMFTRNDIDLQWVNGTQGTVEEMYDNRIVVRTASGIPVDVFAVEWEYAEGYGKKKKTLASIQQFPLRLAWAITVHKSQGMTLDNAIIDVSKAFEYGQGYVAISRVRSLDGLYFQGKLTQRVFQVDPKVQNFYDTFE